MKRLAITIILAALLVVCLTGCWNRRELNDLGIQLGTGFDKKNGRYQVSVQMVDPSSVSARWGNNGRVPVIMYRTAAPTIFEAFRKLTLVSPRKIYGAHIRVLVIGEQLAREGIAKLLDLLSRDSEPRPDLYVVVARNSEAGDILNVMTQLDKIPANKMYYSLDTSSKVWGTTTKITLDLLANQLVQEGINPVLTAISATGNKLVGKSENNVKEIKSSADVKYTGLAVFKQDKLVGWLDLEESKGYNYIMSNVQGTVDSLQCPDGGKIVLETYNSKTSVRPRIEEGKPVIHIKVKSEVNVGEVECKIDLNDTRTIAMLEKRAEEHTEGIIKHVVETAQQQYKSDIFGFGRAIYRSHPRVWNRMKDNWDERFADLKVDYDATVIIRKLGTMNNSMTNKMRE